jgi:hypothetical protein
LKVGTRGFRTFRQKVAGTSCGLGEGEGVGVGSGIAEDDAAGVDIGVETGVLGLAVGRELDNTNEELKGPALEEL